MGAYQALERQIAAGSVTMHPHTEMLDLVVAGGKARGIVTRNLRTGAIRSYAGDAVVLATGGYGNVFYLSTNAKASNCTAIWRAHRRGAYFANPCYTQIHPTCIPVTGDHQSKLTLMSESLRNDGRVWVPKKKGDSRRPNDIPEDERDYYLERRYPSFGNLVPRDVASRAAKEVCDEGRGVGPGGYGVYLDFRDAIERLGLDQIREKYGNLFEIYERITGEDAYQTPDANLPGRALHDGRPLGRLPPDVQYPGALRRRRGQLLGPGSQPAGGQRPHAGPGRRLLHPALHAAQLPGRARNSRRLIRRSPAFAAGRGRGARPDRLAA